MSASSFLTGRKVAILPGAVRRWLQLPIGENQYIPYDLQYEGGSFQGTLRSQFRDVRHDRSHRFGPPFSGA
jgi:hypothetical protein